MTDGIGRWGWLSILFGRLCLLLNIDLADCFGDVLEGIINLLGIDWLFGRALLRGIHFNCVQLLWNLRSLLVVLVLERQLQLRLHGSQ